MPLETLILEQDGSILLQHTDNKLAVLDSEINDDATWIAHWQDTGSAVWQEDLETTPLARLQRKETWKQDQQQMVKGKKQKKQKTQGKEGKKGKWPASSNKGDRIQVSTYYTMTSVIDWLMLSQF